MNTSGITMFVTLLPVGIAIVIIWYMLRRSRAPSMDTFRKSPAQLVQPNITFADVGGLDEAINELRQIIGLLRSRPPGVYPPSGVLLTGEPGTGKTLLAHAVGREAGVPFWVVSGSEFADLFIGVSASRIRDLFVQAGQRTPCIVFIDQIDVIGRQRTVGSKLGEWQQALSQLCIELDNRNLSAPVLVIAATNRPDLLDPALLRSGRLESHIRLSFPDAVGRTQILRIHTRNYILSQEVNLDEIATATEQFVGADLARLVNEAALYMLRAGRKVITVDDFENAIQLIRQTIHQPSIEI